MKVFNSKMIVASMCLLSAALVSAQIEPAILPAPTRTDIGCPPPMPLAPPPEGCHYEFETDENGCSVNPHLVCGEDGETTCPPPTPLARPPEGCDYEYETDENGCRVNPQLVCDGDETTPNPNCPMFKLVAPEPGCHYEYDIDEEGCRTNPHQVCIGCPIYNMMRPAPGCHWEFDQDENGCDTNPHQVCDDEIVTEHPGCPVYMMIPAEPGCHYEFDKDENGCDVNAHQVCDDGHAIEEPPLPPVLPTSCAAVSCFVGNDCQVINGVAQCVPANSTGDGECGENQEMKACGSACPETCEQVTSGVYPMCIRKCVLNVCQCKQGYALDADNNCVPREQCHRSSGEPVDPIVDPAPTGCGPNEELKECGTMCPLTCKQHVLGIDVACIEMCQLNVCQCKDGYALDENQRCVKLDECRKAGGRGKGRGKGRRPTRGQRRQ